MNLFMDSLRWAHIIAGFIALAAFWGPVFTRKGGNNHRLMGKVFKYFAYVVLGAAGIAVVLHVSMGLASGDTFAARPNDYGFVIFLGFLALVTFTGLRHGVNVLLHKPTLATMNRPLDRFLAWSCGVASIGMISFAFIYQPDVKHLLLIFSLLGFLTTYENLRAIKGKRTEKKAWFYEHMSSMLGVGIAFHTAFAIFGVSQLFSMQLSGPLAIVPWVAPAAIGITADAIWTRYYRRKFGDLARGEA